VFTPTIRLGAESNRRAWFRAAGTLERPILGMPAAPPISPLAMPPGKKELLDLRRYDGFGRLSDQLVGQPLDVVAAAPRNRMAAVVRFSCLDEDLGLAAMRAEKIGSARAIASNPARLVCSRLRWPPCVAATASMLAGAPSRC